jgi:AP-3 complex subunit beta
MVQEKAPKEKEIKDLLCSNFDRDKLNALTTLFGMMSDGKNAREHFADVVKLCTSTTSFAVRKLVYVYLLHYADQEPDLALLSINSFQKDLSDSNMLIRAMALRVLSSIKVLYKAAYSRSLSCPTSLQWQ